ncbi:hypothetical protein JKG47_01820 [Acidithiobacillus sp. MC6.1]|nr:hypothetical protein [Acidithiobacillus sp. MC6.1]
MARLDMEVFHALAKTIAGDPERWRQQVSPFSLLHRKFKAYPDIHRDGYLVSAYLGSAESVNPMELVGTAHPDYVGLTSLEMLTAGKRMASLNLPLLAQNPEYYLETGKKEPVMNYSRVDGDLYISCEGNHRSAICRCLYATLGIATFHGVEYTDFQTDRVTPKQVAEAQGLIVSRRLPLHLEAITTVVRRDDSPGWKKDHYETVIKVMNYQRGTERDLQPFDLPGFLHALDATRFWHRWTGKNPYPDILP